MPVGLNVPCTHTCARATEATPSRIEANVAMVSSRRVDKVRARGSNMRATKITEAARPRHPRTHRFSESMTDCQWLFSGAADLQPVVDAQDAVDVGQLLRLLLLLRRIHGSFQHRDA